MPIYEYECAACGRTFEEMQKMSAAPLKKCALCGAGKVRRLISQTSFRLKGTGWYQTDYAQKKPGRSEGEADKGSDKKEGEAAKGSGKKEGDPAPPST